MMFMFMVIKHRTKVATLTRKRDRAQLAYRNARSTVGFDTDKKEDLKMAMRAAKHKCKKAEAQLGKFRKELKKRRDMVSLRKGPNGFKKYVKQKRREGVPMRYKGKPIKWRLERFKNHVHAEDGKVDPFKNNMVAIGRQLR